MKSIKLTEEHKSKLLEMCNKLFIGDKYENFTIQKFLMSDQKGNCHHHSSEKNKQFLYVSIDMGFPLNIIHWFEFCMTHLINALAWENITSDIVADCQYEEARLKYLLELGKDRPDPGQYHPIDYLYEEFKKLF